MTNRYQGSAVAFCFILIGILFLIPATIITSQTFIFVTKAIPVPGRVIAWESRKDTRSETYVSVFSFADRAGQYHTNHASLAQRPPTHKIGTDVTVLYLPGNPDVAKIKSFNTLWFAPVFISGFGVIFTGFGALALYAIKKTYGNKPS